MQEYGPERHVRIRIAEDHVARLEALRADEYRQTACRLEPNLRCGYVHSAPNRRLSPVHSVL